MPTTTDYEREIHTSRRDTWNGRSRREPPTGPPMEMNKTQQIERAENEGLRITLDRGASE